MIMTKHDAATGKRVRVSLQVTDGRPSAGSPPGTGPMTAMPCAENWNAALAAMLPRTATNGIGMLGMRRLPSRIAAATRTASAAVGRLALGNARASCQARARVLCAWVAIAEHVPQHGDADLQTDAGEETDQDRA